MITPGVTSIRELLHSRPYPGRGLLAARTKGGGRCIVYFLTGRSPASREREIAVLDGGDVAVRSVAPEQATDVLRHYVAAAQRGPQVVVGNGSQVARLAEALAAGAGPLDAWAAHTYEPDGPIFTPRIWVSTTTAGDAPCLIGYATRSDRADGDVDRVIWAPGRLAPGDGTLMSTYDASAAHVRTARLPQSVRCSASTPEELLAEVWAGLDPDLRVAAFALDPGDFAASLQIVG
jgi:IMP cyclohydrolase